MEKEQDCYVKIHKNGDSFLFCKCEKCDISDFNPKEECCFALKNSIREGLFYKEKNHFRLAQQCNKKNWEDWYPIYCPFCGKKFLYE